VTKPSLNAQSEDVLNAEKILSALGYDVDTPDNLMDEKTVKRWQSFRETADCILTEFWTLPHSRR